MGIKRKISELSFFLCFHGGSKGWLGEKLGWVRVFNAKIFGGVGWEGG